MFVTENKLCSIPNPLEEELGKRPLNYILRKKSFLVHFRHVRPIPNIMILKCVTNTYYNMLHQQYKISIIFSTFTEIAKRIQEHRDLCKKNPLLCILIILRYFKYNELKNNH